MGKMWKHKNDGESKLQRGGLIVETFKMIKFRPRCGGLNLEK